MSHPLSQKRRETALDKHCSNKIVSSDNKEQTTVWSTTKISYLLSLLGICHYRDCSHHWEFIIIVIIIMSWLVLVLVVVWFDSKINQLCLHCTLIKVFIMCKHSAKWKKGKVKRSQETSKQVHTTQQYNHSFLL